MRDESVFCELAYRGEIALMDKTKLAICFGLLDKKSREETRNASDYILSGGSSSWGKQFRVHS